MKRLLLLLCIFFANLLFGCAGEFVHRTSPNFNELRPALVAVMPVMNETLDLDAPAPFVRLVRGALINRGYRVVEQFLVDKKMEKEGIKIAAEARAIPNEEYAEEFKAQGLLFTTVTSWETVYLGVYASVSVGAKFELVDAKTSEVLWYIEDEVKDIRIAVDKKSAEYTAAFAVLQAYEPYAGKLVKKSFALLPIGPLRQAIPPPKPKLLEDETYCCCGQ